MRAHRSALCLTLTSVMFCFILQTLPGAAHDLDDLYGPLPLALFTAHEAPDDELIPVDPPHLYHKTGIQRYQKDLSLNHAAFIEIAGEVEEDDPLEEFPDHVNDPANWNPAEFVERRLMYGLNAGWRHRQTFGEGYHVMLLGFQTQIEKPLPDWGSSSPGASLGITPDWAPLDFTYAPFLEMHMTPFSWLRLRGEIRADVLHYDIQGVCRTVCWQGMREQGRAMVPGLLGEVSLGPWSGTELFLHVRSGFFQYDDWEPSGSIANERVPQALGYEVGFRTRPRPQVELNASLWVVDLQSDLRYARGEGSFEPTSGSRRVGINLTSHVHALDWLSLAGGFFLSRMDKKGTDPAFPFEPTWHGHVLATIQLQEPWDATVRLGYSGSRRTDAPQPTTIGPTATLNVHTRYRFLLPSGSRRLEVFGGLLNITNATAPTTQFSFHSGLGHAQATGISFHHFPGQPRSLVGGIMWTF